MLASSTRSLLALRELGRSLRMVPMGFVLLGASRGYLLLRQLAISTAVGAIAHCTNKYLVAAHRHSVVWGRFCILYFVAEALLPFSL